MSKEGSHNRGGTRVLLIGQDVVGPKMAGSGIRTWNLARVLSAACQVTLASPLSGEVSSHAFKVVPISLDEPAEIDPLLAEADVVVSNGNLLNDYPQLADIKVPWVVDAYVPTPTEALAANAHREISERLAGCQVDTRVVNHFLSRADFVICASERQRDLYMGLMASLGRLNPRVYDEDPTLRRLVDTVPYGLSAEPPIHTRQVIKGVVPGISPSDRVILWGGGLWNWFDPLTLIRAMPSLIDRHPEARLVFPGTRHPYAERIPVMEMQERATLLSDRLGLTDRHVFFGGWASYDDRPNYLLESDVGVSLHPQGVEPRYAYRTRILDYIWAGLPMVLSRGDVLADLAETEGLGLVVEPGDVDQVAGALVSLLGEEDARGRRAEAFARVASSMTWEQVARPLVEFCQHPRLAADRRAGYLAHSFAEEEIGRLRRELRDSEARLTSLQRLVSDYENGRLMRLMAALKRWRHSVLGRGSDA